MSISNKIVADIFTPFQSYINLEQDTREAIRAIMKEIEIPLRQIATVLQGIHNRSCGEQNEVARACMTARNLFEEVRAGFLKLNEVVPEGQYYRYNDHWRYPVQRLCFLAALIIYLEKGFLIDKETAAQIIGVHETSKLHLDLEDYLMGLLQLASELSRFAVNSVTLGDYEKPLQISKFVAELSAGFRLLNLKNDALRKRFDALKYDVKKIEEVVYDLSIRGLIPSSSVSAEPAVQENE